MKFQKTQIKDSLIITLEKIRDKRGYFTTSWNSKDFQKCSLNSKLVECNISFNKKKGTLRGLHYQIKPFQQIKLVRVTKGKIFDVVLDLRPKSLSFKKWTGTILSEQNSKMNYVPEGCAHGFLTLENNTEVFYQMSQFYSPKSSRGVLWNDDTFKIKWPIKPIVLSDKDKSWNLYN